VAVAGLPVVDIATTVDKRAVISDIRLLRKSGGKSGDFVR
jgi:cyclic pyranopterin monophosphate synthase